MLAVVCADACVFCQLVLADVVLLWVQLGL